MLFNVKFEARPGLHTIITIDLSFNGETKIIEGTHRHPELQYAIETLARATFYSICREAVHLLDLNDEMVSLILSSISSGEGFSSAAV